MAKATKVNLPVQKTRTRKQVTYYEEPYTERQTIINLALTEGEADCLIAILAKIGGSRTRSPRKYVHRISGALTTALGYGYMMSDAYKLLEGFRFKSYENCRAGSESDE